MPHVTFIHGIANKPPADELIGIWRQALAAEDGIDLGNRGITSSMVYWADVLHAEPADDENAHESVRTETATERPDHNDEAWRSTLEGDEKAFVDSIATSLNFDAESPDGDDHEPEPTGEQGFERIPLPWSVKRRLMKTLLRDVHHYLFNVEHTPREGGPTYRVQDEIRARLVSALRQDAPAAGNGPHVLVSHSMGTVIAYDCLKRVPDCPEIDALMTIGSPLGIDEVQDKLRPEWTRANGYPAGKVTDSWANVFDRLDPVALDPGLSNDFRRNGAEVIQDQRQRNKGKWRHSINKYLLQDELRTILARQLGINWS